MSEPLAVVRVHVGGGDQIKVRLIPPNEGLDDGLVELKMGLCSVYVTHGGVPVLERAVAEARRMLDEAAKGPSDA